MKFYLLLLKISWFLKVIGSLKSIGSFMSCWWLELIEHPIKFEQRIIHPKTDSGVSCIVVVKLETSIQLASGSS